jgi:putative transcriptional regulator
LSPEPRNPEIRLDKPVMLGGPLAEDRGFILHTPPSDFSSSIRISDNTVITTSRDVLETLGTDKQPGNVLVALGYPPGRKASWSRRFWITPGSPPRRIRIFCSARRSPIAGARRRN